MSCIAIAMNAQTGNITLEEALEYVREDYVDRDVDYYLCDTNVGLYQIFVDEEPLKGWEHDCCIYTFYHRGASGLVLMPTIQRLKLPPNVTLTPLDVTNRYGHRAREKPLVISPNTPNNQTNEVAERTYAVILSGGINKNANNERYWNDCSFIYQTLVKKYDIPRGNIKVIMSDGTDPAPDMRLTTGGYISSPLDLDSDGTNDIEYAATLTNVQNVLNSLSTTLNEDDHLFIFVIDHGGSTDKISGSYICLWNGQNLYDYTLADWLTPFCNKYVNVNVVLGQCYSGGFIDDLTKVGCVVAAASSGSESSWSCPDIPYDEFVYHWTSAVNQANSYGTAVMSDTNGDGMVTMDEAFNYAQENDRVWETPQYISTPLSVGEDLAFNHLAPAVDLYIRDNIEDTGKEPNLTTDLFWKSPDVWIRNDKDGIEEHENPYYDIDNESVVIYIRVHNRGKKDFDGIGQWAHAYWALASTALTVKAWKGQEVNEDEVVTGDHLRGTPIPPIPADSFADVTINWALPLDLIGSTDDNGTEKHHFCILGRVLNTSTDNPNDTTATSNFNVQRNRKLAQKNVSIISRTEANQSTNVYVRNITNTPQSYSLEIRPHSEADAQIFTTANVELKMSTPILRAWQRGGCQSNNLLYLPAQDSLKVTFTSSESRMRRINLYGDEFEKVAMKFDFHTATPFGTTYSFDLIQRDEFGNIVGGETFIVQAPYIPLVPPIVIFPNETGDGQIELGANLDGTEQVTKWTDASGNVISESNSAIVSPTLNNNTYALRVITADGELATGSITLEPTNGIKSVSPTTSVNDYIDVELDNEVKSSNSLIAVSSVLTGLTELNVPIPEGTKAVRIDTSSLSSGLYVLSYIVDGQVIDTVKFGK